MYLYICIYIHDIFIFIQTYLRTYSTNASATTPLIGSNSYKCIYIYAYTFMCIFVYTYILTFTNISLSVSLTLSPYLYVQHTKICNNAHTGSNSSNISLSVSLTLAPYICIQHTTYASATIHIPAATLRLQSVTKQSRCKS